MLKRWLLYYLGGALLLSASLSLFQTPNVSAAGESYTWVNYSKIGARGGSYASLNIRALGNETPQDFSQPYDVEFTQDENDPHLFTAKPGTPDCPGELKLTLTSTPGSREGNLQVSNCAPLTQATNPVTIRDDGAIFAKTSNDQAIMRSAFMEKNCPSKDSDGSPQAQARQQDCEDQAQTAYTTAVNECKQQFNYENSPQLANKYLTCLAEKLCVDRPSETTEAKEPKDTPPKCALGDIGWIVCQIFQLESWLADKSFELLSRFMTVDPLKKEVQLPTPPQGQPQNPQAPSQQGQTADRNRNTQLPTTAGNETTVYSAWKLFLGVTNLIFIAAFLLVIFSYITGWGLSAYNIKRTLPRMIVAVILSSGSFLICALAVDLSNVVGKFTQQTLIDISPPGSYGSWTEITSKVVSTTGSDEETSSTPDTEFTEPSSQPQTTPPSNPSQGTCTANIQPQPDVQQNSEEDQGIDEPRSFDATTQQKLMVGGAYVFGPMIIFALLIVLLPFMTAALLAIVATLIILMLRQVIIIVLVVISPVAFAFFVLPNTKKWFEKWKTTFTTVLMLYPIVSLIYGAAYFASQTIYSRSEEYDSLLLSMFALGILTIPLFMTPALMKMGGGLMEKFAGVVQQKNPLNRLQGMADAHSESRKNVKRRQAANASGLRLLNPAVQMRRFGMRSQAKSQQTNRTLQHVQARYNASQGMNTASSAGTSSQSIDQILADELSKLDSIHMKEIKAISGQFEQTKDHDEIKEMAQSGMDGSRVLSDVERAAAVQAALNHASSEEVHDIIAESGKMGDLARRTLVDSMRKTGFTKQNSHFGGGAMNQILEGKVNGQGDIDNIMARAASANAYGSNVLANQSDYTIGRLSELKRQGKIDATGVGNLQRSAATIGGSAKLRGQVAPDTLAAIERLGR